MDHPSNGPFQISVAVWESQLQALYIVVEAQAVIVYRTLGMVGLWPLNQGEGQRMFAEKPPAFTASAVAAGTKALAGARPDEVMSAALGPIRRETHDNVKRLGRRH